MVAGLLLSHFDESEIVSKLIPVIAEINKVPKKPIIHSPANEMEINRMNCERGDLDFNMPVIM